MSGEEEEKIVPVPLHQIVPLPYNVCTMDADTDLMLKTDMTRIETKGRKRIDPILLRRLTPEEIEEYRKKGNPSAQYMIVDGHSRWEAARELGWHEIRAIITDMTLDEAREFNYKKNKVRGTVDPLREAAYFRYLRDTKKMKIDEIAEKFGITHRRVEQILSRIKIAEPVKEILKRGEPGFTPSPKHYEILGSVEQPEKQKQLAEIMVKEELSRREAEVAKEAIEKGLSPEKTVQIVKTVKREKLAPKEARKLIQAVAVKPEIAEEIIKLPKEKLVAEAEKIISPPPPPPKAEELRAKMLEELTVHYPPIIVDYAYTRYKGPLLKEVIKAMIFHAFWDKLTEEEREEVALKSIKEVEEKGKFEEPVIG